MTIGRRIAVWSLALLALAGLTQAAQNARELLMERLREGAPAYTEAQAQAYVKEVLPVVEQVAGRKFKTTPKIKLVRRDEPMPVLEKDRIKR